MLTLRHRLLQRGYLAFSRLSRGMTLGVRALMLDGGTVVLVRHSYLPGWYLPGGGVEAGESMAEALQREIREETGSMLTGPPQLFGIYRNAEADRRDHVALYVCRHWKAMPGGWRRSAEIIGMERFPCAALPPEATRATRARLAEILGDLPPAEDW